MKQRIDPFIVVFAIFEFVVLCLFVYLKVRMS